MLVGYVRITNNYESGYDSYLIDDTKPLLAYSRLGTSNLSIQGRALPICRFRYRSNWYYNVNIADTKFIAIISVDGLFFL
jgi:hypothetical protein